MGILDWEVYHSAEAVHTGCLEGETGRGWTGVGFSFLPWFESVVVAAVAAALAFHWCSLCYSCHLSGNQGMEQELGPRPA